MSDDDDYNVSDDDDDDVDDANEPNRPVYQYLSNLVPEHQDLDRAKLHLHTKIPGRSEKGDADEPELKKRAKKRHFKKMLAALRRAAVPSGSTPPPTICMVPPELTSSEYNPKGEYEPVAVGLGGSFWSPYMKSLEPLHRYKWCCVRQLIGRRDTERANARVLLQRCFKAMKRLVPEFRASYLRRRHPDDDDEVAEMMLLDGCFILHRLLKYAKMEEAGGGGGGDRFVDDDEDWTQVYGRCFVWQLVTRDLLLLQNQIPFFMIRELFQQLRKEDEAEELLVTGGLRLFRSLGLQMPHRSPIACDGVHHLLHLFYLSVGRPPGDRQQHPRPRQSDELLSELSQWIPCAKELQEAGVRFRRRKNATSFMDVRFARGVLEVPRLELNDYSEPLFRNLIAFEQTYPDTPRDVSTYAVFMDCLVTSPEDMRILDLHGVLVSHLNSRRVAWQFFGDIVRQVHWSADNYLVGLMNEVNSYRERRRHKWRAALVRNYFSNPWRIMSVIAAVVLLLMSGLQTFFAVYAYFKPPK